MRFSQIFLLINLLWCIVVYPSSHFLSFIIPCYNRAYCIKETITSIYQQKNLDIPFEVICVDDCSSDDTCSVLKELSENHTNLFVYYHSSNKGAPIARNTAVSYSKGDLIFNLDSDNILEPNSVRQLIDLLDTTPYEAVAFQEARYFIKHLTDYAGKLKRSYAKKGYFDFEDIITDMKAPANGGNYLYTRKSYDRAGGYPDVRTGDCWGFGLRQVATGTKIGYVPGTYYWHRFSPDSNWNRWKKRGMTSRCFLKTTCEFLEFFTKETVSLLNHYDIKKRLFPVDIDKHVFKLIPKSAQRKLVQARRRAFEEK